MSDLKAFILALYKRRSNTRRDVEVRTLCSFSLQSGLIYLSSRNADSDIFQPEGTAPLGTRLCEVSNIGSSSDTVGCATALPPHKVSGSISDGIIRNYSSTWSFWPHARYARLSRNISWGFMCWSSWNLWASNSWNSQDLFRTVKGLLSSFYVVIYIPYFIMGVCFVRWTVIFRLSF
jgi:hypothetical protein